MDSTQNRYWPFDVLPPERQTEQHREEIRFLETAYQAGYKPYMDGFQNFGATAGERGGVILYRGCRGKHWEVLLGTTEEPAVPKLKRNRGSENRASEIGLEESIAGRFQWEKSCKPIPWERSPSNARASYVGRA
jgi:hypothetical protein